MKIKLIFLLILTGGGIFFFFEGRGAEMFELASESKADEVEEEKESEEKSEEGEDKKKDAEEEKKEEGSSEEASSLEINSEGSSAVESASAVDLVEEKKEEGEVSGGTMEIVGTEKETRKINEGEILETEKNTNTNTNTNTNNLLPSEQKLSGEKIEKEVQKGTVIINEVAWMGTENSGYDEWMELYNENAEEVDLEDWTLEAGDGTPKIKLKGKISAGGYFLLERTDDDSVPKEKADQIYVGALGNDGEELKLKNEEGEVMDELNANDGWPAGDNDDKRTMEKIEKGWQNSREPGGTPRAQNSLGEKEDEEENESEVREEEKEEGEEKTESPYKIRLNEVLANPAGSDKNNEWLELASAETEEINLNGWLIENGKGKKHAIGEEKIKTGELFLLKLENTSFAIRNTDETLFLYDEQNRLVDEAKINGSARSAIAWVFDGEKWSWSRRPTPGGPNWINQPPRIRIKKPKNVYQDVYALFDASQTKDSNGDELKFRWEFGDGHRSYLEETRHKYEKKKKHTVTLRVDDGSDYFFKTFSIKVKSFPRYDIRLTKLVPNPKGKDSGQEIIGLENMSRHRIDLSLFKIATGKDEESLTNHPFYEELILKSKEKEEITNEKVCKFSLLNTKALVRLLYPDGEVADEVIYEKEKILDDEAYVLVDDEWEWVGGQEVSNESELTDQEGETTAENESIVLGWSITANKQSRFCECWQKMALENWLAKNKHWLSWLREIG